MKDAVRELVCATGERSDGRSLGADGSLALGASSLRFVDELADLAVLFEPQVNVVLLRRSLSAALRAECARAVAQPGFRRLFSVAADETCEPQIAAEFVDLPHMASEVQQWVEVLAELTGATRVGVRVARLESAMCPRFHVDRVTLRLVSTYCGVGTQFVASEHFDRAQLGHPARGEHAHAEHCADDAHTAQPGDIVLLKGEAWPENAGRGAVHRSPSASAVAPRLVMTLDPL